MLRSFNTLSNVLEISVYLNSSGFSSDFPYFLNYRIPFAMYDFLPLKHPFIYYPPETLWLVLLRHDLKKYYRYKLNLNEDKIMTRIMYIFKTHNYRATRNQMEKLYSKLLFRFKNLLNQKKSK